MSVTSAMFTGVSGLLNNGDAMNVIGNNISNVNTLGFKGSRTIFSDMLYAKTGNNSQVGRGVQTQTVDTSFSQGSFESTTNVTDLAVQGDNFFAVKDPTVTAPINQNAAYLTRAGAFHVDNNLFLVNPDGYQVLDTQGNPIQFLNTNTPGSSTDFGKILSVGSDGLISYLATDGITANYYNASAAVGVPAIPANASAAQKLALVSVTDPTALEKEGGSLYKPTATSGVPAAAFTLAANAPNGTSEKVLSNTLELSNVDMASEFVNMIMTQRAYSANSKTITTVDEMTQEVLSLKR